MSYLHRFINYSWGKISFTNSIASSSHGQKSEFKKQVYKSSPYYPPEVKLWEKNENTSLHSSGVLNKSY